MSTPRATQTVAAPARSTGTANVRPPVQSELRACRMILPEAFQRGAVPDLLLAVSADPRRFLGVASYDVVLFEGTPAWQLRLHVVGAYRRQGVGRSLVAALTARGLPRGVRALIAPQHDHEPEALPFLSRLGFAHVFRASRYLGDLERYRLVVKPLADRLRLAGKIPAGARAVRIEEAPAEGLSALLSEHAARTPHSIGTPWADAAHRRSVREGSAVLMLDDLVIGAILAERHGSVADINWRVVAPAYRGGWANVMLNAATWDHLSAHGVSQVRFSATTTTPDTQRFVALYGAERAVHVDHYRLPLDPSVSQAIRA